MADDWDDRWDRLDPAYGARAEFAELIRASGRRQNELGHGQMMGAGNLLDKALRALGAGDHERVDRLLDRVAAMPYDARDQLSPGVMAAQVLVHQLVTDRYEDSDADDSEWLEIALAAHDRLDGPGRDDLASVLHGLVLQADLYQLSTYERRRIRSTVGGAPLEADLGDGPQMPTSERRVVIASLLQAALALSQAYAGS